MMFKCPGSQSFSQPHPESIQCPSCDAEVEIWSDEVKATCSECGKVFMREGEQTCLDWCRYTKECLGDDLYVKFMKNKAVTMKIKLMKDLEDHFGVDTKRIEHARKVMGYADDLLRKEKGDWHIVIPASILHDVGIKISEEKYGNASGKNQEKEGPEIARKIMLKHGFKMADIDEICRIIANHHSPGKVDTNNFKILCDADWLVNLKDEVKGADSQKLEKIIEKTLLTATGKEMARKIYLS